MQCGICDQLLEQQQKNSGKTSEIQIKSVVNSIVPMLVSDFDNFTTVV